MQQNLEPGESLASQHHLYLYTAQDVAPSENDYHTDGSIEVSNKAYIALPITPASEQWSFALSGRKPSIAYLLWSRVLDILFGLCGTLCMILILPTVALFIYLDSPGPIFYRQKRMGYGGKNFTIFKFRSMSPDAEQGGQAVWAAVDDTRITRTGRFMRAIHLDELPQSLNILRGEMSLIGPRPEREDFVTELQQMIPFYHKRLTIKPGLTGWAQVNYHYARSNQDALIKCYHDLYYIQHRSFKLDLLILLKTVVEVLSHHGS